MNEKNKIWFFLLVILLLGAFLRFYKLGEKSFRADEFLGVNTVYGYLQTGEWRRWDFNMGKPYVDKPYFKTFFDFDFRNKDNKTYTRAWIYNWQVAQVLRIFPNKEYSYRIVSVVWGIISILLIYFITFKITGKKMIALISAFLLAVSIDSIEFSRKMRMYAMFMPIFFVFTYYVFLFLESKRKSSLIVIENMRKKTGLNFIFIAPVVLLGLLSMHLHLLTVNIVFVVLLYFLVMSMIYYKRKGNFKNKYVVYFLITVIIGWLFSLNNKVFLDSLGFQDHFSYFEKSFADYSSSIIAILLLLTGTFYFFKNKNKAGIFTVSSYFSIFFGAMFLWDRNTGNQYLFFAKPFQTILIAAGIFFIADFLKNNSKKHVRKIFIMTIIILLLVTPNFAYFFQDENTYKQTSRSGNPNYRKIFKYVIKKRSYNDVLITRNFRNFYWADQKMSVYSLGGERASKKEKKLTLTKLKDIIKKNKSGWLIYSDNDESFISKDAKNYIEKNLKKISNPYVRGPISVWRWGNSN